MTKEQKLNRKLYMQEYEKHRPSRAVERRTYLKEWSRKRRRTAKYKTYMRNYFLKRKFGITLDDYINLLKTQQFQCAICKTLLKKAKRMGAVDHDHKTNRIRGILCTSCNTGLGQFKDSVKLLDCAIKYLATV